MSKEKQIEEMAKALNEATFGVNKHTLADHLKPEIINKVAEYLYNAGYRKQSEGEWIKHPVSYECTACKEEFFVEGYAEDYDPITDCDLHFCPNCGAKMKGGEE
jgi:DNA-directed RNA polymerase subunit RPC12/RpoP